jgi:CcmD family protein
MEVTLAGLLADIRNLSYMFFGFALIWVVVLGYLWTVSRQGRDLDSEVEELKKSIDPESKRES